MTDENTEWSQADDDAGRAKAAELLSFPEVDESSAEPGGELAETQGGDTENHSEGSEKPNEDELEAKFASSFAAIRRQQKQAAQLLATAKEERRVAKEEREKLAAEIELAGMLKRAGDDPNAFFEAAKRAGVPAAAMADFLVQEKEPTTHVMRELDAAKEEIAKLRTHLTERERREHEYQQQVAMQRVQQAEGQIGEKFVGYLVDNLDNYPALATQSEDDIRTSAIYWAREEYKATGSLPTAEKLATFLEYHAMQRVQSTPAARRAQAAQPSQRARTANGSMGESLSNDDASEASVSVDDDSPQARRARAIAVLKQNWHVTR